MRKYNTIRKTFRVTFYIIISLFISTDAFSNNSDNPSIFDKLSFQEVMEITLEMDMESVFGNRRSNAKSKAIFSYNDENGIAQTWNIKVALRGRFRRIQCEGMAPLKLNFKKGDLEKAGLSKFDDMKLVTQCVEDQKEAKQLLVKEYLAYKIYNQISEESFRVQFLKINYKDSKTSSITEQWGILIEDTAELRARLNVAKGVKLYNLGREKFHSESYKTVAFFQYMIGNPDWNSDHVHNVKLFAKDNKYLIVPYDFDFSGLVGAPYASINSDYQLKSNKDRVYLGFEEDLENYDELLQFFSLKKDSILQTIRDCELLSRKNRREMIRYIKSFYTDVEDIYYPSFPVNPSTPGE